MSPDTVENRQKTIEEAIQMMENNAPPSDVIDKIWFGFSFHLESPEYHPEMLPIARRLYDTCKEHGAPDSIPNCMLFFGRIYNAKGEYLPACRFYRVAKATFKGPTGIVAMEFFREELRSDEGRRQIGLSRDEFYDKYGGDTPELLVSQYGQQNP